ncbi:uncharacterized protein BHQ10_003697 [Talaromyces amestolkiae]|uniref:Protein kinase domain-containing protein n=1 Tax=Talaromyces amestolkiae TaxID=1196081 RepID=A0A364KVU8_TALAM|nr:uncharacterized protein BHQ10_003697 [Talaromyces amestolkiae]RAO67685.1 hypothetical protein BHQ10_003697 [Talaromyces amestolkiae]
MTLEDRFEVIKEVGDGSFGSVVLARTRTAGSNVARRGTMVAIKTMKKNFESFAPCLELREVIFLRTLPHHTHIVPALDIFLDPLSKKLHICMEYMDGNLYQLMKARDQKYLEAKHVKSILYQIMSGLDHIHAHNFFHRDIKPENILVSTSAPNDSSAFSRYSNLVTPPSTPPTYTVKIADFGLARETHSKSPYTTYVSTRWYRAPEVLLRAGEYSAPVDIWAVGAMAVEIATLKPLFPGVNEVDQVWRICEIMGSPGNWYTKSGAKVGGGEWREGNKLAQKLGFTFPKMAPHSMSSILQGPHWPQSLSNFVTWCLMWDPRNRPTSTQALNHEYFADAVDPLRPKSSASRLLGRKMSEKSFKPAGTKETTELPALSSKPSWFRRSLVLRTDSPAPLLEPEAAVRPPAVSYNTVPEVQASKGRSVKRATWANGAPMPILPSIRPVSPLSNAVTAQANSSVAHGNDHHVTVEESGKSKKIGRQLSVNSHGNHYADIHRQEAERALNGLNGGANTSTPKESFFSHLRKRARRLSGRNQAAAAAPTSNYDIEANAGCSPWPNRSSVVLDSGMIDTKTGDFSELDKTLQGVKYGLSSAANPPPQITSIPNQILSKRQSVPQVPMRSMTESPTPSVGGPISSRTRRALQMTSHPVHRYETPEEEDELLDEVLHSADKAARRLAQHYDAESTSSLYKEDHRLSHLVNDSTRTLNPYPTPSPSAKRDGVSFGDIDNTPIRQRDVSKMDEDSSRQWPTPPYGEQEWASSVANSILSGSTYR